MPYSRQDPNVEARNGSGEGHPDVHKGTSQYHDGSNRALIPRRKCKTKQSIPTMRSGRSGQVVSSSKTCASPHSSRCLLVAGRHDCSTNPPKRTCICSHRVRHLLQYSFRIIFPCNSTLPLIPRCSYSILLILILPPLAKRHSCSLAPIIFCHRIRNII